MAALNDSRMTGGREEYKSWANKYSSYEEDPQASLDGGFDTSYHGSRPQRTDACTAEGFSLEHQINTLRQVTARHERQIAALAEDRHAHCDHLTNVYEQLERVLEKLQLPPCPSTADVNALSPHVGPSPPLASPVGLNSSGIHYAASIIQNSSLSLATQRKRAEDRLNEVLSQHREQVFDVLTDYRAQVSKTAQETKRRLDSIDKSVAHLRSDMEELKQLVSSAERARQSGESQLRDELQSLAKQQEAFSASVDTHANEHAERVQRCCDDLGACVAQLSDETKAIRKEQQRSAKELDRQIRAIVSTEQQVAEVLERQSHSITQLETQNSLEHAFHELKDWLGDLEKRMVSRGELLKWTESLQQEISTLRRVTVPSVSAGTADLAATNTTGFSGSNGAATPTFAGGVAGYAFTPRTDSR